MDVLNLIEQSETNEKGIRFEMVLNYFNKFYVRVFEEITSSIWAKQFNNVEQDIISYTRFSCLPFCATKGQDFNLKINQRDARLFLRDIDECSKQLSQIDSRVNNINELEQICKQLNKEFDHEKYSRQIEVISNKPITIPISVLFEFCLMENKIQSMNIKDFANLQ